MAQIDMPMPECCANCPFANADLINGIITLACMTPVGRKMYAPDLISRKTRPEWCPLKEQEAIESIDFGDRTDIMANLEGLTWDDWRMYHSDSEVQNIAQSAFYLLIALLKEQEPMKVKTDMYGNAYCPWCSTDRTIEMGAQRLHLGTQFCPYCGKAVKWND